MSTLVTRFGRIALLCLAACGLPCLAQSDAALERQVKAAFLYRFVDYVRWPEAVFPRSDSPIVIGVLADATTVAEVQAVASGRVVRGHPLVVRQVREGDLGGLQVLFIGEGANARLQRIIRSVEGSVLIVTEAEDGLAHGSVINFVIAERRVRFEVALQPAAARSLTIASGLLSVAINVRKDSRFRDSQGGVLASARIRNRLLADRVRPLPTG